MWFEAKIQRYDAQLDKVISEAYLFDAETWGDAESKAYKYSEEYSFEMFNIKAIKKAKLTSVVPYDEGESWLEVVVQVLSIDDSLTEEKYFKETYLVLADDIYQAIQRISDEVELNATTDLLSVKFSQIVEVIPK